MQMYLAFACLTSDTLSRMFVIFYFLISQIASLTIITPEEEADIRKLCERSSRTRVLNGEAVKSGELNYVVGIFIGTKASSASRCAGTVVSSRHVLTAAHCFLKKSPCKNTTTVEETFKQTKSYVHYGGECMKLKAGADCGNVRGTRRVLVKSIAIPYTYYNSTCKSSDIAIIEVDVPFNFNTENVTRACIPTSKDQLQPVLSSAGYGHDPKNKKAKQKMLEAASFKTDKFCDPSLKAPKDSFCVEESNQFMCKGDSGTGAIQPLQNGNVQIMGVLHGGLKCSLVENYVNLKDSDDQHFRGSIYTDLRKYLGWICKETQICQTKKPSKLKTVYL